MSDQDLGAIKAQLGALAKAMPQTAQGFQGLSKAAGADGRFTGGQKELVAVAIAAVIPCEGCITYHVDAAKRGGASREELLEVLAVAVEMGGGPAMLHAAQALAEWDKA
jgi:AhpD family alkylhydroperoxidase